MKEVAKYIFIQTRWEDVHHWEGAPPEVAFLRSVHRHEFHMKLSANVSHDDRDIEFIMFKRWVEAKVIPELKAMPLQKSCEMMCRRTAELVFDEYEGVEKVTVEISEDGESGSYVTYIKDV